MIAESDTPPVMTIEEFHLKRQDYECLHPNIERSRVIQAALVSSGKTPAEALRYLSEYRWCVEKEARHTMLEAHLTDAIKGAIDAAKIN